MRLILSVLPHSDSCNHASEILKSNGVKDSNAINAINELLAFCVEHQREIEEKAFKGEPVLVHINPDDLALLNAASQGELNKPISTIAFEMAYLEPDKNIGQERQIPIIVLLGDEGQTIEQYAKSNKESLEVCQPKLKSLLNTWLHSLGLAYDEKNATLIKHDTKQIPTQAELKNMLSSEVGENANKAITEEAKNTNLLNKNGKLDTILIVLPFTNRERAVSVFDDNKVVP
jgi:hypothetical protein